MKIGMVAGEPSGDILGAGLIQALKKTHPDLTANGVGGIEMLAKGFHSFYDIEKLSLMGFIDPLLHLRELLSIRNGLYQHFLQNRPDVFVGIDSPDFNLGLEIKLRKEKIPIVHYVSPSVWAWRQKRIIKIAKAVDLMLTLFPFEADFYKAHGIPVHFVGHPLADLIPLEPNKLAARKKLNLDPEKKYIAILPGSRRSELKNIAPLFIKTAYRAWKLRPSLRFITVAANAKRNHDFQTLWQSNAASVPIQFFERCAHDVLEAADVVLVASGTATLETMLYKRPMIIAFRTNALTFQIAKYLVKTPFIGLPNLLANEQCVPEFIQHTATPEKLTLALFDYLDHPEKVNFLEKKFTYLHQKLRQNANQEAAHAILKLIKS